MMMRRIVVSLAMCGLMALPAPVLAQADAKTLADIRAELAQLSAEFTSLKQELVTSGAAKSGAAGGDALQRLDAIEAQLATLTSKTEAVELKVNRVVSDGTKRVGDLEFRVCELEKGCDPANLPDTQPLGGAAGASGGGAAVAPPSASPSADAGPELAVAEKDDFDRAKAVYDKKDYAGAATAMQTFVGNYPGSPLMQDAQLIRGDALSQTGDTAGAARSYLDAFSGKPTGAKAGTALVRLGQSLGKLGQVPEACVTLKEVGNRFPGSADAAEAASSMQALACP